MSKESHTALYRIHGTTPPQYVTEPYGAEVLFEPVTASVSVVLDPSSFWAVAHKVRPLLFGPVRMTGRE